MLCDKFPFPRSISQLKTSSQEFGILSPPLPPPLVSSVCGKCFLTCTEYIHETLDYLMRRKGRAKNNIEYTPLSFCVLYVRLNQSVRFHQCVTTIIFLNEIYNMRQSMSSGGGY